MSVDSALFRLRAFESEWYRLLRALEGAVSSESSPPLERRVVPLGLFELMDVLDTEMHYWRDLGMGIGYFAETEEFGAPRPSGDYSRLFLLAYSPGMPGSAPNLSQETFFNALVEAQEDLFPERLEFLRILVFAGAREWERALRNVKKVADSLRQRPWIEIPGEIVDSVTWSLSGADVAGSDDWSPAAWRMGSLVRAQAEDESQPSNIAQRLSQLEQVREPILGAMEWLAMDEQGEAAGRFAAERQAELLQERSSDADYFSEEGD